MTTTLRTTSSRQTIFAAVACFALLSANGVSFAFTEDNNDPSTCSFSKQLENHADRDAFQARVKQAKDASTSRFGEFEGESSRLFSQDNEQIVIDAFTFECVSCHDGSNASNHSIRFKNAGKFDPNNAAGPLGSHPLGMHYGEASYGNDHLKKPQELHGDMLFAGGRVGCLSCHNPLNSKRNHLVMENDRSDLCFSCHSF